MRNPDAMLRVLSLCLICFFLSREVSSQNFTEGDNCTDVYVHHSGGVFSSPNYPGNYSENLVCHYYVTAPEDNYVALVFSTPFEIEANFPCPYDFLSVYDGLSKNNTILGKFCGYEVPSPVFSYGRYLSARFSSDSFVQYSGFRASIFFRRENCLFEVLKNGSLLTSPNYPADYNNIERCEYIVTAPAGHYVSLTFFDFSLEDSTNCRSDAVTLYDGDAISNPVLQVLCGSIPPQTFFSNGNKLLVRMTSDLMNTSYGFNASVSFHKDSCYYNITENGTVITSPNYPENYRNFEKCVYHVHSGEGKVVELTFITLDVEDDDNCLKDRLTIYDGSLPSSVVLTKLCGSKLQSLVIPTKSQDLMIVFKTNNIVTQSGFSARVNFVLAPCPFCSVLDRYHHNCPSHASPPSPFQQIQLNLLPPVEFLQCRILTGQNVTPSYYGNYYWMIADCPDGTNTILASQCNREDRNSHINQDIYIPPVYHPTLQVLFRNQFCAICNGYSPDELNKMIVYTICDTCKFTYEFEDGDVLEAPSSDCIVHPNFAILQECDPFHYNKDVECPSFKTPKEVSRIFQIVSTKSPTSLTCLNDEIIFGEKCVKIQSSCSGNFQQNFLVLYLDNKKYSMCNYLRQRSTVCLFQHLKNFQKASLQHATFNDTEPEEFLYNLTDFSLPWINADPFEWLEYLRGNSSVLEIPTNVTSKFKWRENVFAALQNVVKIGGPIWTVTDNCFLKTVELIEICKADLQQDIRKCNGVIQEAEYDEDEEVVTDFRKNGEMKEILWYGLTTTMHLSPEPALERKLVFCISDVDNNENNRSSNLFSDIWCGIAVTFLFATFCIYVSLASLRNTFGIVVMIFVASLAIGIILLQFINPYIIDIPWFCSLMAIFAHWLWISVFCWMTVLAYDLHNTFVATKLQVLSKIDRKLLMAYLSFGWGFPFIVVSICIILWTFTKAPINYGSNSGGECWIYGSTAAFCAVSGPLILCVLANFIFFVLIVRGILKNRSITKDMKSSTKVSRRNASRGRIMVPELVVCIKISLLMGFTWLSGYLAPLTKVDAFNYVFYIMIGLQAILIFLFFGANIRVRQLWMRKLGISKLRSYADSFIESSRVRSMDTST